TSKRELQTELVSLNEVIDESVPLIEMELSRNDVLMELQLARTLPEVVGDRVQLQQVFINLAVNAIQAMSSTTDRPPRLAVWTRLDGDDKVLVAVRDSGPGFAPGAEANLFNAFFTTKPNGMGMGLSIVHSIIKAHGGRVWACNNDQGGATFQFTIPLRSE